MIQSPKVPPRRRAALTAGNKEPEAKLRIVFTEDQIQRRVSQMAAKISRDYRHRTLHLVGLLETSFIFIADLIHLLRISLVCHFLRVVTEDRSWHGVPLRQITYSPRLDLQGKDVLLVDGVLQTGVTLDFLLRSIQGQSPHSLRTAALVEKTHEKKVGVAADYVGFKTRTKFRFLVGYGLGQNGEYCNLPYIADLE